jgi:hypothetical protein
MKYSLILIKILSILEIKKTGLSRTIIIFLENDKFLVLNNAISKTVLCLSS